MLGYVGLTHGLIVVFLKFRLSDFSQLLTIASRVILYLFMYFVAIIVLHIKMLIAEITFINRTFTRQFLVFLRVKSICIISFNSYSHHTREISWANKLRKKVVCVPCSELP